MLHRITEHSGFMRIDPANEFGSANQPILSTELADERSTPTIPEDPSGWPTKNLGRLFNRYPVASCAVRLRFIFVGRVIPGELYAAMPIVARIRVVCLSRTQILLGSAANSSSLGTANRPSTAGPRGTRAPPLVLAVSRINNFSRRNLQYLRSQRFGTY